MLLGGLRRLEKEVRTRDENAIYLNSLLDGIDGVMPLRRRTQITRASYFNFGFRLDPAMLKDAGIGNSEFSAALAAETGLEWEPPYEPLNNCSLYKPRSKRRHKLNADYWKAINPKRFKLPVLEDAHYHSGVVCHHHFLLGTKKQMDAVAEAVAKVVDQAGELKKAGRQTRKINRALV
jgi:L-glutamine:2-deoxy-scyllo-inosose/3-amino-2,3-dideoxy-scyllo-inosose aminotransferase